MPLFPARIRLIVAGCVVALTLACSGVLGTPLEQVERAYPDRIERLEALQTEVEDPTVKAEIQAAIEKHQAAYAAAPSAEEARADAIGKVNMAAHQDISRFEGMVQAQRDRAEMAAAADFEKWRRNWDGRWSGQGHVLHIGSDDSVHYENNAGAMKKTIDASVVELTREKLVVGALGINTTFQVDQEPTLVDDKTWVMKLDGVTYTWLGP